MNDQTKGAARAASATVRLGAISLHEVRIPWVQLLSLATQVEREAAASPSGSPTTETTLRLARAIILYQQQMLGRREHRSG